MYYNVLRVDESCAVSVDLVLSFREHHMVRPCCVVGCKRSDRRHVKLRHRAPLQGADERSGSSASDCPYPNDASTHASAAVTSRPTITTTIEFSVSYIRVSASVTNDLRLFLRGEWRRKCELLARCSHLAAQRSTKHKTNIAVTKFFLLFWWRKLSAGA